MSVEVFDEKQESENHRIDTENVKLQWEDDERFEQEIRKKAEKEQIEHQQIVLEKANKGDAIAQYDAGIYYMCGYWDKNKDDEYPSLKSACGWFNKARENSEEGSKIYKKATYELSHCLRRLGIDFLDTDYLLDSEIYLDSAVENKSSYAKYERALRMLADSFVFTKNVAGQLYKANQLGKEAVKQFKKDAKKGDFTALYYLGICHLYGHWVKQSTKKAYKLLTKAEECGSREALSILAAWDEITKTLRIKEKINKQ